MPKIWVNDRIYIDGASPARDMMAETYVNMIEQALDPAVPAGKLSVGN